MEADVEDPQNPYAPPQADPTAPPYNPYAQPYANPLPGQRYTSKTGLVRFLTVCFGGYVVAELLLGAVNLVTAVAMPDIEARAEMGDPGALGLSIVALLVGLAFLVVYLATAITYCIWLHGASNNARALGAQEMTFTPGWSVGWFFIPIANLWKPYHAVKELYQASEPEQDGADWILAAIPSVLPSWWGLWIAASIASQLEFRMSMSGNPELVAAAPWMSLINVPLGIGAAVLCVAVVRRINGRQEARAARLGLAR